MGVPHSKSKLSGPNQKYDCPHLLCLSSSILSVLIYLSVPTYYVCPHLLCLSPPICMSPPIMSVPIYYVCSHSLFCVSLSPTIFFLLTSSSSISGVALPAQLGTKHFFGTNTNKLGWKCHTRDLRRVCQQKN